MNISFSSYFVFPDASVAPNASIGSYCVIALLQHQHLGDREGRFEVVLGQAAIGERCWIGTPPIVMASVGTVSTIGARAVVTDDIPPHPLLWEILPVSFALSGALSQLPETSRRIAGFAHRP